MSSIGRFQFIETITPASATRYETDQVVRAVSAVEFVKARPVQEPVEIPAAVPQPDPEFIPIEWPVIEPVVYHPNYPGSEKRLARVAECVQMAAQYREATLARAVEEAFIETGELDPAKVEASHEA